MKTINLKSALDAKYKLLGLLKYNLAIATTAIQKMFSRHIWQHEKTKECSGCIHPEPGTAKRAPESRKLICDDTGHRLGREGSKTEKQTGGVEGFYILLTSVIYGNITDLPLVFLFGNIKSVCISKLHSVEHTFIYLFI